MPYSWSINLACLVGYVELMHQQVLPWSSAHPLTVMVCISAAECRCAHPTVQSGQSAPNKMFEQECFRSQYSEITTVPIIRIMWNKTDNITVVNSHCICKIYCTFLIIFSVSRDLFPGSLWGLRPWTLTVPRPSVILLPNFQNGTTPMPGRPSRLEAWYLLRHEVACWFATYQLTAWNI